MTATTTQEMKIERWQREPIKFKALFMEGDLSGFFPRLLLTTHPTCVPRQITAFNGMWHQYLYRDNHNLPWGLWVVEGKAIPKRPDDGGRDVEFKASVYRRPTARELTFVIQAKPERLIERWCDELGDEGVWRFWKEFELLSEVGDGDKAVQG